MIDKSIARINDPLKLINKITANLNDTQSQGLMITKQWNLNSTIAHLIGWADQFKNEIDFLLTNGDKQFPWEISAVDNWSAFNDNNVKKLNKSSLKNLLKTFEDINDQITRMLEENQENGKLLTKHEIKYYGKFSPINILQMIKMKAYHEMEHITQIQEKIEAKN